MKSLNDSLRDEFYLILEKSEFKEKIANQKLDNELIKKAFEKLIESKEVGTIEDDINDARSKFQNLIVNHLKSIEV